MPEISVIIPSYNSCDLLLECLSALERSTFDRQRFEVLVIDDGSTDGTEQMVSDYRTTSALDIVYRRRDRSLGFGPGLARNDGLDLARGHIIAFTDADCLPDRNWLSVIDCTINQAGHAVVGGETWCDEVLLFPWKMSPAGQQGITANFAFNRTKVSTVKFSTDFFGLVGDDTDFRLSLLDSGGHKQHYEPTMRVFHAPRRMTLMQVVKRSIWRKQEVLLVKRFGQIADQSFHPLFRPIFFRHFSPLFVVVLAAAVASSALWSQPWFLIAGCTAWLLFSGLFLLKFYRWCITYRPTGQADVTWSERFKTLLALYLYLPCILYARIVGSIQYGYLMI
ncbi:MAG: glycosyltransferase family A protein [Patescibacteria group bacterium]